MEPIIRAHLLRKLHPPVLPGLYQTLRVIPRQAQKLARGLQ